MSALLLALALGDAHAGGFEVARLGAAQSGVGHAGVAGGGGASDAWFNPAALAGERALRASLGVSVASSTVHAEALPEAIDAPWEADTETPPGTPPHLYLALSRNRWAVGLAANTPFAGGLRWPETWPYRFDIIASSPRFFRFTPTFAWRVGPASVAVGAHVDAGSLEVLKATDHISEEGSAHLLMGGWGMGLDAAAYLEPTPRWSLGLRWSGRTDIGLRGDADFDVAAPFAASFPDQGVSTAMRLPGRVALGARWRGEPVGAVAELSWTRWADNEALVLDFEDEATADITQVNAWRSSLALRAGVEGQLQRFTLRGGAYVDGLPEAPPPAETLSPSSPDGTRVGFTLGAGVSLAPGVRLDAFGEHLRLLERASASPDAPQASYRGAATVGGLSLSLDHAQGRRAAPLPAEPLPAEPPAEPPGPWDTPTPDQEPL